MVVERSLVIMVVENVTLKFNKVVNVNNASRDASGANRINKCNLLKKQLRC